MRYLSALSNLFLGKPKRVQANRPVETRRGFIELLPLAVCGRQVNTGRADDGGLMFDVAAHVTPIEFNQSGLDGDDFAVIEQVSATVDEVREFLAHYCELEIGRNVLSPSRRFYQSEEFRFRLLNSSLSAWRSQNGPCDPRGRLRNSMRCTAYLPDPTLPPQKQCGSSTKDTSGLCHRHTKPDVKTIWNYCPLNELIEIYVRWEMDELK